MQIDDRIFTKFHIKFRFVKDKKVMHPRKNLILGEKPEISLKADFFEVGKKFILLMCLHDAAKLSL